MGKQRESNVEGEVAGGEDDFVRLELGDSLGAGWEGCQFYGLEVFGGDWFLWDLFWDGDEVLLYVLGLGLPSYYLVTIFALPLKETFRVTFCFLISCLDQFMQLCDLLVFEIIALGL